MTAGPPHAYHAIDRPDAHTVKKGRRKRPRVADADRKRTTQACESCRRMKEKCQGGRPCNRCKRLKRQCRFIVSSQKRFRRTLADREDDRDDAAPSSDGEQFGELSHSNFSLRVQQRVDGREGGSPRQPRNSAAVLATSSSRFSKLRDAVAAFPPLPVAHFLLDTFFDFAQTNYSYVDEQSLRQKLSHFYANTSNLGVDEAPLLATLLMAFAVGAQFAHLSTESRLDSIDFPGDGNPTSSDDTVALAFYNAAKELITEVLSAASIESVQAFLLFGVYALPVDASGLSWMYFGIALRIAIQNGMHRKQGKVFSEPREAEVRRRIWWTAYTLERRISVLHGKPVSIARVDVDVDLPSELAALDTVARTYTLPNVTAMINLTDKLENARDLISKLQRCSRKERSGKVNLVLVLSEELERYWQSLPDTTFCRDLSPGHQLFRFNVHLALTYHLIHVFIGRSFILKGTELSTDTSPASTSTRNRRPPADWSGQRNALVESSVTHALKIIELCQTLHDGVGLSRSSYTEYTSCCAALLVVLARRITTTDSGLQLQQVCNRGLKLVKNMAVGLYSDTSEKLVVEALEVAVRRLNNSANATRDTSSSSGYASFKNWAMYQQQIADTNEPGNGSTFHGMAHTDLYNSNYADTGNVGAVNAAQEAVEMSSLQDMTEIYPDNSALLFEDFASIPGLDEWFHYGLQ